MTRVRTVLGRRFPRWVVLAVSAVLLVCAAPAAARIAAPPTTAARGGNVAYARTLNYVIRFYPRFLSYWIANQGLPNKFVSPISASDGLLTSHARLINAFNVDTVYASCPNMDLSKGPVILTIPKPSGTFSLATNDVWGNVLNLGIPTDRGGTYALVLAGWHGTLPPGVTRVEVPYPTTSWAVRSDRYSKTGNGYVNTIASSKAFLRGLRLAPLSQYEANPSSGRVISVPQALVSASSKVVADSSLRETPTNYLNYLQRAMHSSSTQPLTASDHALSNAFDRVFAAAKQGVDQGRYAEMSQVQNAAHNADAMIVDRYQSHVIPGTEWVNFNNIADWGTAYLDRDATSAYCLLCNPVATSRYWDAFTDRNGTPLDTNTYSRYTMTFAKANLPNSKRFWSVTAYVGAAIHVTPGPANNGQRNVAEYTPGLQTNRDGSVTIFIQPNPPAIRSRRPNWIFVPPDTPFSLIIRTYGPTGNTAPGVTYIPPEIRPFGVL